MNAINWNEFLRRNGPIVPGATEEQIVLGSERAFYPRITGPEIRQIRDNERNPWLPGTSEYNGWTPTDPSGWVFPSGPFSPSYLSLIRWSNGGNFLAGEDRALRFWGIEGLRGWMMDLHAPKNLPLAIPFAANTFYDIYCFDMREPLVDEYPIIVTLGSAMHYAYTALAAPNLLEFLRLPNNPRPPVWPIAPVN
jgi:hypothetical protein